MIFKVAKFNIKTKNQRIISSKIKICTKWFTLSYAYILSYAYGIWKIIFWAQFFCDYLFFTKLSPTLTRLKTPLVTLTRMPSSFFAVDGVNLLRWRAHHSLLVWQKPLNPLLIQCFLKIYKILLSADSILPYVDSSGALCKTFQLFFFFC